MYTHAFPGYADASTGHRRILPHTFARCLSKKGACSHLHSRRSQAPPARQTLPAAVFSPLSVSPGEGHAQVLASTGNRRMPPHASRLLLQEGPRPRLYPRREPCRSLQRPPLPSTVRLLLFMLSPLIPEGGMLMPPTQEESCFPPPQGTAARRRVAPTCISRMGPRPTPSGIMRCPASNPGGVISCLLLFQEGAMPTRPLPGGDMSTLP